MLRTVVIASSISFWISSVEVSAAVSIEVNPSFHVQAWRS